MSTWTVEQRRSKLQGQSGSPGFAEDTRHAIDSWQAYLYIKEDSSAVHFYSDDRCSADKLVYSVPVSHDGCVHDSFRGLYYKASCNPGLDSSLGQCNVLAARLAICCLVLACLKTQHAEGLSLKGTIGPYHWILHLDSPTHNGVYLRAYPWPILPRRQPIWAALRELFLR